ncbi:MAG: hypothetical protein JSS27_10030 [Planctomycetes bacterium]|nr:hypothetical protein [Planctomycetota bacterium]
MRATRRTKKLVNAPEQVATQSSPSWAWMLIAGGLLVFSLVTMFRPGF